MLESIFKTAAARERCRMTVCISALAEQARAIVCVADRALTYGQAIQWESDSSKMFSLRKGGMVIMFAGEEEPISRILGKVIAKEEELGKDVAITRRILESEYQEAVQELVEAKFLTPRLLTREQYIKAISGTDINATMQSVATEISMYSPDASLIVSGFDEKGAAFILAVDPPGVVTDMTITGFHSIGTGSEKSVSKLLFQTSLGKTRFTPLCMTYLMRRPLLRRRQGWGQTGRHG